MEEKLKIYERMAKELMQKWKQKPETLYPELIHILQSLGIDWIEENKTIKK
jgi:hypothetical protein